MVLEICPSADIHLALNAPFTRVSLYAVQHTGPTSLRVPLSALTFTIEGAPATSPLDNGKIRIDAATGEVTALQASTSWVWVSHTEQVGLTTYDRRVPVRVMVHTALRMPPLGTPWVANDRASLHAGNDDLVISVYAENDEHQVVDITGHGFVTFTVSMSRFSVLPWRHEDAVDLVNGAHTAATVELAVDNPSLYQPGDLLLVHRTGEYLRVTRADGTSPIAVTRGVGGPAAALADNDETWLIAGVDSLTGRVRASMAAAGTTLDLGAMCDATLINCPQVRVRPALLEAAGEPPAVAAQRAVVEALPFRAGIGAPRRNILLLAEGFTASQETHFKRFARRLARRLTKRRAHEPFRMLRHDYRLWLALLPSDVPGVAVNTRVDADGKPGDIATINGRLLQVPDCACGMGYGRRAGEIPFDAATAGPLPSAEPTWQKQPRETTQLLKDWRRLGSRRDEWQTEALELFAGLRQKDTDPADDSEYRIGETWGPGGADQGLVLLLVNDQISAGTYTQGDANRPNGFLFGAITTQNADHFTIEENGTSIKHTPGFDTLLESKIEFGRVVESVHELSHGLFLGDEYEDAKKLGQLPQERAWPHDNLDTGLRIDANGVTKFAKMPRVVKSATLLTTAQVDVNAPGRITVLLRALEGNLWDGHTEPVALQTRNINDASLATIHDEYHNPQQVYTTYPAFRAHPYLQATGLTIAKVTGDEIELTGTSLAAGNTFPAGSMLYEPKPCSDVNPQPLSLVLPGVVAYMTGRTQPLLQKAPNDCAKADSAITVFPKPTAADLKIVARRKAYETIGLYEGGGQANCAIYRPTGQCAMRNAVVPRENVAIYTHDRVIRFCHVCRYAIVNEINPGRHAELDQLYPGEPLP